MLKLVVGAFIFLWVLPGGLIGLWYLRRYLKDQARLREDRRRRELDEEITKLLK